MRVDEFTYELPDAAIAQEAIEPRHASRLLDARDLTDHHFIDLPGLLEPTDIVVVNNTKVRSARLSGRKADTGGQVEMLLLEHGDDGVWQGMVRPARRLRPGSVLVFPGLTATILEGPVNGLVEVTFDIDAVEEAIEDGGDTPLPPYFTGSLPSADRYQTLFARQVGSAAAPTAGLHFTHEVVERMSSRGIRIAEVDLHVGIDTFRPMQVHDVEDHRMHTEWCSVPAETAQAIADTRQRGGRVVAIGTTSTRALESFGNPDGTVAPGQKRTDIYLRPGSTFQVVDLLVTNFHVPGSTLVVMLAAFMGQAWRFTYETALQRGYRFLSFGDAMLCERIVTA